MSTNKSKVTFKGEKTNTIKQNSRAPDISKKERYTNNKGLKRRLSGESDVCQKKTCTETTLHIDKKNKITDTKKFEGKNLAQNRLAPCRETKVVTDSNVNTDCKKHPDKNIAKNRLTLLRENLKRTSQTTLASLPKDTVKKTNTSLSPSLSPNVITPTKGNVNSSSYKIPKRKSANDRLKVPKESFLDESKTEQRVSPKVHTSPLKRASNSSAPVTHRRDSRGSLSLSKDFIVLSEASLSEGSFNYTSPLHRTSLESNNSDKTLTPGSDKKLINSEYFKTPPTPQILFGSKESKVTNERGVPGAIKKVQIEEKNSSNGIFGTQQHGNIFLNYGNTQKTNSLFSSNLQTHNNNNNFIDSTSKETVQNSRSIFGTPDGPKSLHTRKSSNPTNIFNEEEQSVSPGEPEKSLVRYIPDKPVEYVEKQSHTVKSSLSDRLARIKNDTCNSYKTYVIYGKSANDYSSSQLMETERLTAALVENPQGSIIRIHEFSDHLGQPQLPGSSPNKCQKCSKEFLTERWLTTHQCTQNNIDTTISDSMIVNVNDSIFNKSELPDPQEDVSMDWDSVPQASENPQTISPTPPEPTKKENILCIVTDTNVFMHSLHKIKDILNLRVSGSQKIKLYVPWMVLKELDDLKDRCGQPTKSIALEAEKFINRHLSEKDSKIIGQSVLEVSQQKDIGKSPDDKILASCMQAVEKYENVILLTSDVNLRSKALVNNLETCTPQVVLDRLNKILCKREKFCKIRTKLVTLWSSIICDCCKEAYGDAWKKMDMLQNPPWSMVECIKRFQKYWGSVFRGILLKQSRKTIDGIHTFLMAHKDDIVDDSENFNDFLKQVVEFLVFLRDITAHKGTIQKTLNEIVEVASS